MSICNQSGLVDSQETADHLRRQIDSALWGLDLQQIKTVRKLTPADRTQIALSMIDVAEQAGVAQLRRREPWLSEEEALRLVRGGLTNYYKEKRQSLAQTLALQNLSGK